ncbi:MAG: hypothetical protein ACW96U_07815 [Candidatus Heimdallarchaeaceae archaeon]
MIIKNEKTSGLTELKLDLEKELELRKAIHRAVLIGKRMGEPYVTILKELQAKEELYPFLELKTEELRKFIREIQAEMDHRYALQIAVMVS